MYWDDLRYFLALQRHGRLVAAGRSLNVDHTTVGRRVKELESALDTKLFEKKESGFEVTVAGENLIDYAETIERTVLGIKEKVCLDSQTIKGSVNISSPEDFGIYFLATRLPELLSKYQELEIDMLSNNQDLNASGKKADITITTNRPSNERMVVRRLADYTLGLFASNQYFDVNPEIKEKDDIFQHKLINCVDDKNCEDIIKNSIIEKCKKISFRSGNHAAQYKAAENGYGICLMPYFMKNEYSNLTQVLEEEIKIKQTLWLVVHEDVRNINRIKETSNFIADIVYSNRSIFS